MWPWAAGCVLCGALATTALQLPAHWVAPAVERAAGQRIQLRDVRGTVWSGSAVVSLAAGPGSRDVHVLPGRTAWRLAPSVIASPGLHLSIEQACCLRQPLRVHMAPSQGGVDLRIGELDWQGPASIVQGLGMPWNTLGFEGRLGMSAPMPHVHRRGGQMRLDGRLSVTAESVSSRISFLRSLGSYRFEIEGEGEEAGRGDLLRFTLATLQGPLRLNGQGVWTAGQLRFRGEAQADPGREEALANVLNLIGNRNGPVALRVVR